MSCNTVTRTLHTPNVLKLLHQARTPEASTRGTRHQQAHAPPLQVTSVLSTPQRTPNAHAADGARYVNVTHEEATEEAAATTEAGTAGAGTSAETDSTPHRRPRQPARPVTRPRTPMAHSQANAPSRRAHTIRCPRTQGKRLKSRTKPTVRHRHPPVQKLVVAWLIP